MDTANPIEIQNPLDSKPDVESSGQRIAILAAIFIVSAALMLALNWGLRFDLGDDAYIHLRIARNMIETGHPYFNAGEPVMVTSSPVWTLLLVINQLLFGSRNTLWIWNALFSALTAAASYRIAWFHVASLGWRQKLAALVLPVTVLAVLSTSFFGMETAFATLLLLAAAVAFLRSSSWALPLLALAAFTRYEMAVLFALASLVCLWKGKALKYGAAPAAAIVSILALWLLKEFHTIFPSAVAAKSRVYSLTFNDTLDSLLPHPLVLSNFRNGFLCLTLILIGFWVAEPILHKSSRRPVNIAALALLCWGTLSGFLYVLGKTFIFPWYVALVWGPLLTGFFLTLIIDESKPRRIAALSLAFIFFLNIYTSPIDTAEAAWASRAPGSAVLNQDARVHAYLTLGALLHNICPNSELLSSEIGGLGYSFGGYIADGVGIATPDALKYHPMAVPSQRSRSDRGAIPPQFVLERNPDLVVTFDIFGEAVTASPEIQAAYQDLRFFPVLRSEVGTNGPPFGARFLHVLVRKGGACPADRVSDTVATVLTPVKPPTSGPQPAVKH